jgi:signal transduction histidine kinase
VRGEAVLASSESSVARRAAGFAHDLGKPLFVVGHLSERARQRTPDPALRRDLETLVAMSREMNGMLRGFLEELRGTPPVPRLAPLATLAARALEVVGSAHGRARLRLRLDRDAARARAPAPLVRALVNLLENALLAAPRESRVELRAHLRRGSLRIEVADRGPGLPADLTARPGGHGIGLASTRDLLHGLGGRLDLRSDRAHGTRARIVLPVSAG